MARFFGNVGFGLSTEVEPSVWSDTITERPFYGDVSSESRSLSPTDQVNDDIRSSNRISIVADAFALEHFLSIKYVELYGALWKVVTAEVQRPRINLTLGGVYDGPRAESS